MKNLKLYAFLSRVLPLNYRMKIMMVAFVGTHVPLLTLIIYSVLQSSASLSTILWTIGVALVATLVGTGVTLVVLNGMLAPVLQTSKALSVYRARRELTPLPDNFTDEAGTLMADAGATLAQLETSLTQLETTDWVTGLANRASFLRLVGYELSNGPIAVGIIRMRNYADLRGTYDREAADNFVRTIAARLTQAIGPGRPLAKLDGTDFAVILPADVADEMLQRIIAQCGAPAPIGGAEVAPDLGAGVSLAPDDATDAVALVDNAVAATARTSQREPIAFYSPQAHVEAQQRFTLAHELRTATIKNQFELHYQPVIDIHGRKVVGAEALVRWRHPERGLIPPGLFIPTAEQSGLIDDIGMWVLREACVQVARWKAEKMPLLTVAINVSARQFLDPRLLDTLRGTIEEVGISPEALEIELTESAALVDYEHTRATFARLRDLGVAVAIDDFGTGYASMSYLRKLPFSKLKIDREFVSHVDSKESEQAICNSMIALGRGLGLTVLAEGVERDEEVRYLTEQGCDLFQGYYFARPTPASEMSEVLADLEMKFDEPGVAGGVTRLRSA